jgi:hypothetical protein
MSHNVYHTEQLHCKLQNKFWHEKHTAVCLWIMCFMYIRKHRRTSNQRFRNFALPATIIEFLINLFTEYEVVV